MSITEYWNKEILVLGCGNILFGDDGFGPAVIEYLKNNYDIPTKVCVMNAGLSVREILFNLTLNKERPNKIIIVDVFLNRPLAPNK